MFKELSLTIETPLPQLWQKLEKSYVNVPSEIEQQMRLALCCSHKKALVLDDVSINFLLVSPMRRGNVGIDRNTDALSKNVWIRVTDDGVTCFGL